MWKDLKAFILRGNVLDLAVGIIIGAAFGSTSTSPDSTTTPWPRPRPPAPSTKDCPFCLSAVPLKATRCPHCTSQLAAGAEQRA